MVCANPIAGWLDKNVKRALGNGVQHGEHCTSKKEAGWEEWLHKHCLWDDTLDKDTLHTRYWKFSQMCFGVILAGNWRRFFHDLLPIEKGLAFREGIGKVTQWTFCFHVHDKRPIRLKPIQYGAAKWLWLRK